MILFLKTKCGETINFTFRIINDNVLENCYITNTYYSTFSILT